MTDPKKIRHFRYLELLKTRKASELAALLGVEANYLSRVKSGPDAKGGKAIGADTAREWEKKLGLPQYWFEGPDVPGMREATAIYHGVRLTRAGALLAQEWEKLDLSDRIEIETQILERVARKIRADRNDEKRPQRKT